MGFFNFKLEDLLNGDDWFATNIESVPALQKRVELPTLELGMFDVIDITRFPDGLIWLDLLSKKYAPTKPLMDLMCYCTNRWGNDSLGRGLPSYDDSDALRNGTFGRTWENIKLIQIKRPEHNQLTIALRIIIDNDMQNFVSTLENKSLYFTPKDKTEKEYLSINNLNTCQSPQKVGCSITEYIICAIIALLLFPLGTIGVLIYIILKYHKRKNNKSNTTIKT